MADHRQLHVVMFPWLAHGHITPYLDLAKGLLSHGLRISFLSTPLNIARIKKQIVPGIELVELPLPSVDGLPSGVESTAGLSEIGRTDLVPLLVQAIDLCEEPLGALLKLLSPNFVIHDPLLYWIPRVAKKKGIPTINLMVVNMAAMSFTIGQLRQGLPEIPTAEDLTVPPPEFPSLGVRRRIFETRKDLPLYQNKRHNICDDLAFMDRLSLSVEESWATACNTCRELDGKFVDYFQRITGRLMFPVGISMPSLPLRPDADRCLDWLDKQPARSVVFASFGSECVFTAQELGALVLGLDECKISFLCVLLGNAAAELHQGFEDHTHGRGLVITEWAPQLHILNHPSTGAFLSHCGWNSVTEGLRFGQPFVALPIQYEQGITARLIAEDLKLGVEVRRNEEDGSFTKEDVAKAVRAVMVEEEGKRIKSNVEEISRVLTSNDCQVRRTNIRNFVSALKDKASSKQTV
ncbi:putative UDP-rhamnose:rhamnosyltransferase 1 [Cryptomeria japonica]|uniref:putative UDP-rhamnose:rhamnosyltransferase 1 n=1 Tax=Cryptomeria japonica TaxID=3369 RepID=UPI0027DA3090|nr:putative UDP-rhamnose:rhamnosyltransferase 1 [Cryptomeria japonica]XP_059070415.1 putative UDP-rhamnose:rhamnosyltransferase 1 [Cryptomeria japonica]